MSEDLGSENRLKMEKVISESTMHQAMDRFLDTVVRYKCVDREARMSYYRLIQAIHDRLYQEGLWPRQILYTGSMFEGMPRDACSDMDVMITKNGWPVVVCETPSDTPIQGQLIANMNREQPAYLTLQVSPDTDNPDVKRAIVQVMGDTGVPKSYISGPMFLTSLMSGMNRASRVIHGPAATTKNVNMIGQMDSVPCFHCPTWPPCASEFLTRPRSHGWPSQSLRCKIQQAGCHVVGVGHPHSDNKDIEWRWSFSVAEKELIHDMCDTMAGVMYVVKAIKNKHWTDHGPDKTTTFCSYYIKTACLWVCEETDQSSTAIMDLCRQVIDWLVTCYRTHTLPHYFIRGQNLIGHLSQDMCKGVVRWLERVNEKLWEFLLNNMKMDGNINAAIEFLEDKLSMSTLGATSTNVHRYETLITDLCSNDESKETLEEAAQLLEYRSNTYIQEYRSYLGYWSDISIDSTVYDVISQQIKVNTAPSTIVSLPEKLLQPLLSDLHSVVKGTHVDIYRSAIHRYLGDLYHILSVHYRHGEGETRQVMEVCQDKAVHYYKEGLEMVYPDGWSDRGLGGYVRLATFYHLSGQTDRVEETLQHLEPLLEWSSADDVINTLGPVIIRRWKQCSVIPRSEKIHPTSLGYFIQARELMGCVCYLDDDSKLTSWEPTVHNATVVENDRAIIAKLQDILFNVKEEDMKKSSETFMAMTISILGDVQETGLKTELDGIETDFERELETTETELEGTHL